MAATCTAYAESDAPYALFSKQKSVISRGCLYERNNFIYNSFSVEPIWRKRVLTDGRKRGLDIG